jgi:hypothetical protein
MFMVSFFPPLVGPATRFYDLAKSSPSCCVLEGWRDLVQCGVTGCEWRTCSDYIVDRQIDDDAGIFPRALLVWS